MYTMLGVLVIFGWAAALMFTMSRLRKTGKYDIQQGFSRMPNRVNVILRNQTMSFFFVLGLAYLFDTFFINYGQTNAFHIVLDTLVILLIYDLLYYAMHRSLHHPSLMKKIHGVHHKARKVAAPESLYLHWIENIAGLVLLFGVMASFGSINVITFLVIFATYTTVMILNHTGMVFPHPIFKPLNYMAIKHDRHHSTHLDKNYASIFTFIYDRAFQSYK